MIDASSKIEEVFKAETLSFENVKYYYLMQFGNAACGIALAIIVLLFLRRINKDKVLNKGNEYHDHSYFMYWISSKILGYRTCKLVNVPIAMQFKLLIRDTFSEYAYGDKNDYKELNDESIYITMPSGEITDAVNLILADTYPISSKMMPESTGQLSTYKVERENRENSVRVFSMRFYEKIRNIVQGMPTNVYRINLFSTLNPKHCWWIARNVFKQAGRCNLKELYIYPQKFKTNEWNFEETGIRIFKNKR